MTNAPDAMIARDMAIPRGMSIVPAARADASALSAVALAYAQGRGAPRVSAKGRGLIAEEIIRRAKEAGIYVHESRELVGLLMQVDLDRHIPPQLYVVVAELFAWLHRVGQECNKEKS